MYSFLITVNNIGITFFRLQTCFISIANIFFKSWPPPQKKLSMNFKGQILGNNLLRVNLGEAQVISHILAWILNKSQVSNYEAILS